MNIRRHVGGHVIPVGWWTPELHRAVSEVPTRVWTESVLSERDTFNALRHFKPIDARVVILGQDPYPKPGKANGLSFGIRPDWVGDRTVSSSGNVAREACRGAIRPGFDFTLESWARQGVLLLNTDLSVRPGEPGSHRGVWRSVVRRIVEQLPAGVAWLAWGRQAADFARRNQRELDHVFDSTHPCRYSAGRASNRLDAFIGNGHFGKVNELLSRMGRPPIRWSKYQGDLK